jgi:hypothetical protein
VKFFDFLCPSGHREEHVVRSADVTEHVCDECGQVAVKVPSATRCVLEGHSGHFPGAAMKWEREHEKAGRGSHTFD